MAKAVTVNQIRDVPFALALALLALGCSTLLLQFRQDSLHSYPFPNIPISL